LLADFNIDIHSRYRYMLELSCSVLRHRGILVLVVSSVENEL